jgi:hypothetical protein
MKRVHLLVVALLAILLVYNPINSLLGVVVHKALPHSIFIMVIALVIAACYRWKKDGLKAFTQSPLAVKLAAGLILWCGINTLYGMASKAEAIRAINVDFGGALLFIIVWLIVPSMDEAKRLRQVMLAGLGLIGIFAIPDIISANAFETWANYLPLHTIEQRIPQIRSITSGPNPFGTLLAVAAFIVVTVFDSPWVVGVGVGICGLLMGLTYARSAWIGVAVAAGGYFAYGWFKQKQVTVWPIILAVTIIFGAGAGAVRFHEGPAGVFIHGKSTEEHQQAATVAAQSTVSEPWSRKIFGYGLGMAGPIVLSDPHTLKQIQNLPYLQPITESWYIQVMQEIGFIGLVIYLWLYVEVTRKLWIRDKLIAFLAVGLAVNAITLETWAADANLNLLFWALAALSLYSARNHAKS